MGPRVPVGTVGRTQQQLLHLSALRDSDYGDILLLDLRENWGKVECSLPRQRARPRGAHPDAWLWSGHEEKVSSFCLAEQSFLSTGAQCWCWLPGEPIRESAVSQGWPVWHGHPP